MISQQIKRQKTPLFGTRRALTSAGDTKMTVLLVLATFLVFIVLDYALNRNRAIATAPALAPQSIAAAIGGDYVGGFHVPENVAYHPGHSWLVRERKNVVRIG